MTDKTWCRWSNAVLVSIVAGASLTSSQPALAWGAAGHRIIAAIAWENLQPGPRDEVTSLLRKHPEHERWMRRPGHSDNARKVFVEASTWADEIRQDTRFYSAGKNDPTPTLPGFPDMERRDDWHYVNIPLNGRPDGRRLSGQIERSLPELARTLAASSDDHERAYAAFPQQAQGFGQKVVVDGEIGEWHVAHLGHLYVAEWHIPNDQIVEARWQW